jgi:hypothetical protein
MSELGFLKLNDIRRMITENGGERLEFVDYRASIDQIETRRLRFLERDVRSRVRRQRSRRSR